MNLQSFAALPDTVQLLLEQRASHIEAIAVIDATLARVSTALGSPIELPAVPAMPKASSVKAPPVAKTIAAKPKQAAKGGQTAGEFIIAYIKEKKNPTSSEINAAWKSDGRKRTADISLSQMTKAKKLIRTPLGAGIRGSRYTLPA